MKQLFNRLALMGALSLSLAACSSVPTASQEEAKPVVHDFPYMRLSPSAPPQLPFEEKMIPMEPLREVWRPGFWDYDGKEFSWVPGHYIYRPDPTAAWMPDRWEQRTFGWAFIPGYWQ